MNRKGDGLHRELQDGLVMIGEVVKPHGIRGEVKIYLFSGQPENFKRHKRVVLQKPSDDRLETYDVVRCREQGKLVIVQLQEIATREAAEILQGSKVWLNRTEFPDLDSDEYYWHQLQDMLVETETGQKLGRVARLFNTTAHDIMVVSGTGQEFLIPVNGDIIRKIDREEGKVVIAPPPGLLEINK